MNKLCIAFGHDLNIKTNTCSRIGCNARYYDLKGDDDQDQK